MKADIREAWASKLESGDIPQGRNALVSLDWEGNIVGACCLGVLCLLAVEAGVKVRVTKDEGCMSFDEENQTLPVSVMEWAALVSANPRVTTVDNTRRTLAIVNDVYNDDFEQIAKLIRDNL